MSVFDSNQSVFVTYGKMLSPAHTNQAILFEIGEEEIWIPKSQIRSISADQVEIPYWFAEKKELI